MARIYPFRALRYDPEKVSLTDVVTQPYDKISAAMQDRYYALSPYNLIRVILGKRQPGDTDPYAPDASRTPQSNVYTRAAESLNAWRRDGILREEAEPAIFGYAQTYTVPGTDETQERRGFIALGQLYDYAEGVIYRHEQTFPKHKSDRLALFKATRAYCEQIYLLYSDPAFTAERLIFDSKGKDANGGAPADLSITDEYGVVHRVWKLTDTHLINLLVTAMADKKLIIADGHHRYETSVAYMHERAAELRLSLSAEGGEFASASDPADTDESPSNLVDEGHSQRLTPPFPEAAMMMTFVNMDAPGITILPTHRVVFGLAPGAVAKFLERAPEFFTVAPLGTQPAAVARSGAAHSAAGTVAFVCVTREGHFLLTARPEPIAAALAAHEPPISPRQAQLDVVQLHRIVLERLLDLSHESIAELANIRYVRDPDEAVVQVTGGDADIAFLIRPVTLDQLRDISLSGDVMPQKSTDFYPKLLSGLAIYALDGEPSAVPHAR